MELKCLRLQNFLSFKDMRHTFLNEPVLIKGKNLTETESQETNGAGKSTMEAGIAFAILATSLRKQTLDKDLIYWGADEAHIWLDIYCPIRKQTLNIHRTLRTKGSQLLELTLNEEEGSVHFATVSDGNNYILNWIGISAVDLKNYYLINKENFKSFVSSSNTERLALISRFIKAEQLDTADDVIKAKNKPLEAQAKEAAFKVATIEGELSVYTQQLEAEAERNLEQERNDKLEALNMRMDGVIARYDKAEQIKQNATLAIKLAEDNIAKEKHKLQDFEKALAELNKQDFTARYKSIQEARATADSKVDAERQQLTDTKKNVQSLSLSIQRLSGILQGTIKCPKCQHEFAIADPDLDLQGVRKKLELETSKRTSTEQQVISLQKRLETLATQLKTFDEETGQVREEEREHLKSVRALQSQVFEVQDTIKRHEQLIKSNQRDIEQMDVELESCNSQSEKLLEEIEKVEKEELETREAELKGIIALTEKKLQKAQKERDKYEAEVSNNVQWGLRMKEFKMSLACEQLRIIQNFANLALQKQRSDLRLSIDGFKRNANGKVKEEITVTVINSEGEYKPFWSFSGGERARIEVALIQAFQEMINGTNEWGGLHFLMIDEVLEGTDPLGLALLLESLNDVGHPVYIISHVMNIRAGVRTLTVVKENGESYIE